MKEPPPPVPLFARPITKIYFRLFREERAKPANPFSILHPSCSCVSRRHVHLRPSLSLLRFSPDSSDACIIEHSFSLFRSASVQPKFSLAITANRILFAIIAGDEPRLPYRVPPPPSFLGRVPWKRNSTVSPTFSTRWIYSPRLGRGTGGAPSILVCTYTCKIRA